MLIPPLTARIISLLTTGETECICKNCGLKFKNPYKRIMNPLLGTCMDPAPTKPIPFWIKQYAIKECPQCKNKLKND